MVPANPLGSDQCALWPFHWHASYRPLAKSTQTGTESQNAQFADWPAHCFTFELLGFVKLLNARSYCQQGWFFNALHIQLEQHQMSMMPNKVFGHKFQQMLLDSVFFNCLENSQKTSSDFTNMYEKSPRFFFGGHVLVHRVLSRLIPQGFTGFMSHSTNPSLEGGKSEYNFMQDDLSGFSGEFFRWVSLPDSGPSTKEIDLASRE